MKASPAHNIDRHHARNTLGISAAEALWGLGLPVLVESTFLQLFLKNLGASDVTIGMMPGLLSAGVAVFALLAAFLTTHLAHKRRAVILTHMAASAPVFAYGLVLFFAGRTPGAVGVFIFFYLLFAFAIGVTLPVWQNFIVSIFSRERMFRALAVMLITQITGRFVGGLILVGFVRRYVFSSASIGVCFMAVGCALFAGSFFFLLVREERDPAAAPVKAHTVRSLAASVREILRNRNFLLFQLSNIDIFACVTIINFYANYAVTHHGVDSAAAAGFFVAVIQGGAVASNLLLGWYNLLEIKSKYFFAKACGISAVALLLAWPELPGFLGASFFIGMARGAHNIAYSPAVKIISGKRDSTDYFSLTPIIMLPFSFGIPYLSGLYLHAAPSSDGGHYHAVFISMAALILVSLGFMIATDLGGKTAADRDMVPLGEEIVPLE